MQRKEGSLGATEQSQVGRAEEIQCQCEESSQRAQSGVKRGPFRRLTETIVSYQPRQGNSHSNVLSLRQL